MATKKQTAMPVKYKREKGKMEISGEPGEIKKHIWFDQLQAFLLWAIPVLVLLCFIPKASWLPIVLRWVRQQLWSIALVCMITPYLLMQLSG